jgi:hypothetical protein
MWPISVSGEEALPVMFTASGGISLGSYQAGVNWALMRFMRTANDSPQYRKAKLLPYFQLVALTGASAGNINAVVTAIEWCTLRPRVDAAIEPESSLFFRTWVNVGWEQLYPEKRNPTENGVFDRTFFRDVLYKEVRQRRERATDPGCRGLPLGITVTRVEPTPLPFADRVTVPTQRMAAVMTFDKQPGAPDGSPQPLHFRQTPGTLRKPSLGALVAPATNESPVIDDSTLLFPFIEASSAYPVAFGPRTMATYDGLALDEDGGCPHAGPRRRECATPPKAAYTDGGVFDNNPLGLAVELYRLSPSTDPQVYEAKPREGRGDPAEVPEADGPYIQTVVEPDGSYRTRRFPLVKSGEPESGRDEIRLPKLPARAIYVDPDILRGRLQRRQSTADEPTEFGGLDAVLRLIQGAIPAARNYELQSLARLLARDGPEHQLARVTAPTRALPLMGEHLGAFGAFFGRPFREYDFYVGAYDGLFYVAEEILCSDDGRRPSGESLAVCRTRELETLLAGQVFPAGKLLPYLAHDIVLAETTSTRLREWPADSADSAAIYEHLVVLKRIVAANRSLLHQPPTTACENPDWRKRALCANGLDRVLRALTREPVPKIAKRWAAKCRRAKSSLDDIAEFCLGDATFLRLVEDRYAFTQEIAWSVGERLLKGERTQRKNEQPEHITVVKAGLVAFRSLDWPARRGMDWDPTSVPPFVGGWRRALLAAWPEHVAFRAYTGGWEAGRRIIYHTPSPHLALAVPFGVSQQRVTDLRGNTRKPNGLVGAGILVKTSGKLVPWITQVQLSGRYQHRLVLHDEDGVPFSKAVSPEIALYGLASKLRGGVSTLPGLYGSRTRFAWTLGLSDVPGILYLLPLPIFR